MVSTITQVAPTAQVASNTTPVGNNNPAGTQNQGNISPETGQIVNGQQQQGGQQNGDGSLFNNIFTLTLNNLQSDVLSAQTDVSLNAEANSGNGITKEQTTELSNNDTLPNLDVQSLPDFDLTQNNLSEEDIDKIVKHFQNISDNQTKINLSDANIKVTTSDNNIELNVAGTEIQLQNNQGQKGTQQVIIKANENPVLKELKNSSEEIKAIETENNNGHSKQDNSHSQNNQNVTLVANAQISSQTTEIDSSQNEIQAGNFERNSNLEIAFKYNPEDENNPNIFNNQLSDQSIFQEYLHEELLSDNNINTNSLNNTDNDEINAQVAIRSDFENMEGESQNGNQSNNNELTSNLESSSSFDISNVVDGDQDNSNFANHVRNSSNATSAQNYLKDTTNITTDFSNFTLNEFGDTQIPASDQVKFAISKNVLSGNNRISVQLEPKDLGRVEIAINVIDNVVSNIRITADKIETLELLQNDHKVLEKSLSDTGLKIASDSINFSLNSNNTDNPNSGSNREFLENNRAFLQSLDGEVLSDNKVIAAGILNGSDKLLDIIV